ncbi:hypothetical protein A7U60_g7049 [Sanghuangporus baumii]|uniref:ABM domain-containing protein n=1 Tax=Sanghuangporus baumii TaxID=108892 RepID=A0A9Q5HTX0_SANBA|nr:hypothetical protein A7U60_g7049 [Sanghuangporus baumii]
MPWRRSSMMTSLSPENVTEIVRFHDFKFNDEEAAALAFTRGLDGCLKSYHGLEVNNTDNGNGVWIQGKSYHGLEVNNTDNGNGVWIQEWLSLAHHTAFQNSPGYPSFVARVASFASTQKLEILHVQLRPYPAEPAFTAPLTEMTVATLKSSSTSEAFEAVLKEAQTQLPSLSYGFVMEDSSRRQYLIVNGWQTIQAFERAKLDTPIFKKLDEIAENSTKLYKLTI